MKPRVMFWGAGGHSLSLSEWLTAEGLRDLAAILVDPSHAAVPHPLLKDLVQDGDAVIARLLGTGTRHFVVAIGDNAARLRIADQLEKSGLSAVSIIHPDATVSPSATVGAGSVIGPGAVIGSAAVIGRHCIVNSGAVVEHDCVLEDGVHIAPCACMAGRVKVGRAAWVGIGATVIGDVSISAGAIIGAGAVVTRDIEADVVAFGVPARVRRSTAAKPERTTACGSGEAGARRPL